MHCDQIPRWRKRPVSWNSPQTPTTVWGRVSPTEFKTFFYVVRHLDSIASYLPTGLHLGFFRSWPYLFHPVLLRSSSCSLLFRHPLQCYLGQSFFCHSLNNGHTMWAGSVQSLRYLHLDEGVFCRVRRLAWCSDPESYAGGSVATGRATLAGRVKKHPDKERYTGPPGWGLGRWASTSSPDKKKTHMLKT